MIFGPRSWATTVAVTLVSPSSTTGSNVLPSSVAHAVDDERLAVANAVLLVAELDDRVVHVLRGYGVETRARCARGRSSVAVRRLPTRSSACTPTRPRRRPTSFSRRGDRFVAVAVLGSRGRAASCGGCGRRASRAWSGRAGGRLAVGGLLLVVVLAELAVGKMDDGRGEALPRPQVSSSSAPDCSAIGRPFASAVSAAASSACGCDRRGCRGGSASSAPPAPRPRPAPPHRSARVAPPRLSAACGRGRLARAARAWVLSRSPRRSPSTRLRGGPALPRASRGAGASSGSSACSTSSALGLVASASAAAALGARRGRVGRSASASAVIGGSPCSDAGQHGVGDALHHRDDPDLHLLADELGRLGDDDLEALDLARHRRGRRTGRARRA